MTVNLPPEPVTAVFHGGPLDQEQYEVPECPAWVWFAEEPSREDITAGPIVAMVRPPTLYHRYELTTAGFYQWTRVAGQITVFAGDAWFTREQPRIERVPAAVGAPE